MDDDAPQLPSAFRLRPSRNQKQRSKLRQAEEEKPADAVAPSEPEPAAPPATPTAPAASPLKNRRLRRSGHMHDDLTAPIPKDREPERDEY